MTSINPLSATIIDMSVVEHHMSPGNLGDKSEYYLAISIKNCLIDQYVADSMQYVAVESTVSIGAATNTVEAPSMIDRIVVGCTVRAPLEKCGSSALIDLERYAVEANVGFARTIVYQQTMTSILPEGLIIPPMVFDSIMEITDE